MKCFHCIQPIEKRDAFGVDERCGHAIHVRPECSGIGSSCKGKFVHEFVQSIGPESADSIPSSSSSSSASCGSSTSTSVPTIAIGPAKRRRASSESSRSNSSGSESSSSDEEEGTDDAGPTSKRSAADTEEKKPKKRKGPGRRPKTYTPEELKKLAPSTRSRHNMRVERDELREEVTVLRREKEAVSMVFQSLANFIADEVCRRLPL